MSEDKLSREESQQFMDLIKQPGTFTPEQLQKVRATLASQKTEKVQKKTAKAPEPPKELTAQYEIIEIQDGCNLHTFKKEPLSKRSYEKERFLIKRGIIDKLKHRIKFMVVLKTPLKEGDKPIPVSLTDKVQISAHLLYTVKTSKTLRTALASLFRKPFNFGFGGKKIILIAVIIGVAALAYLIYTGQLNLGNLIKF